MWLEVCSLKGGRRLAEKRSRILVKALDRTFRSDKEVHVIRVEGSFRLNTRGMNGVRTAIASHVLPGQLVGARVVEDEHVRLHARAAQPAAIGRVGRDLDRRASQRSRNGCCPGTVRYRRGAIGSS